MTDEPPVALVRTPEEGVVPVKPAYLPDLAKLKRRFADSREATLAGRKLSQVAQDYFDDRQWTSDEIKVLRKRKQPQIWVNRIKPAVNGILGVIEQGASDPRAYPRNKPDNDAAEIATDALRYAAERARWQRTKLKCAKDYLVCGTCAVLIGLDADGEVTAERIRWEEFFADPHSRDDDFGDARYMGVAKWMHLDVLKALYPGQAISLEAARSTAGGVTVLDEQDEDRPVTTWGDAKRKRVLVVEMYHDDDGWKRCVFYGGGLLDYGDSPYVETTPDGRATPVNPIVAQSVYVDRDNQRYGVVRSWVPTQDEINTQRSRKIAMMMSRRVRQVDRDVDVNIETVRQEAARPDGVIPFGFDVADNFAAAGAHGAMQSEAQDEMSRQGPNPAVLGRDGQSASGRSHLVRQQAGLTELTPAIGGLEDFELRAYRQKWARIRQGWTAPKMIRVTDHLGAPKFLQVNEPVLEMRAQVVLGPGDVPVLAQVPVQVGVKNRPSEIDVDIIIDSTPDTVSVQQEQFQELVKLAGIYGPQEVPFDDLLEASSLPMKRELLDKRKERQEQAQGAQQPDPRAEAAFAAEIENKAADTQLKKASAIQKIGQAAVQQVNAMVPMSSGPTY